LKELTQVLTKFRYKFIVLRISDGRIFAFSILNTVQLDKEEIVENRVTAFFFGGGCNVKLALSAGKHSQEPYTLTCNDVSN
jgi:hypothetical protein